MGGTKTIPFLLSLISLVGDYLCVYQFDTGKKQSPTATSEFKVPEKTSIKSNNWLMKFLQFVIVHVGLEENIVESICGARLNYDNRITSNSFRKIFGQFSENSWDFGFGSTLLT